MTATLRHRAETPTRGRAQIPALIALAVLVAATTVASPPRATGRQQVGVGRHHDLAPPTSADTTCTTDSTLCLQDGRFLVAATWKKPDGSSGVAHAVSLTSDSGYFWFLEPGNVELVVKTLNACSVSGHHFWFFAGGLTNLEIAITVTDMTTNEVKHYSNSQGSAFLPIADTAAFGCPAGAEALEARSPEEPREDGLAAISALQSAATRADIGCAEDDETLCINGRFQVNATWETPSGKAGTAHAVSLTSESGYFWFFDPSNVELLVKTLDACGIGKGQWFFAAGLTTVGVQLHVTDTFTGETRDYANLLGSKFLPVQDTSAFAFCPTPTPTPTAAPSATPTATPTPTPTVTVRATHTPRPTPSRTPTTTPTPTPTPLPQVFALTVDCSTQVIDCPNAVSLPRPPPVRTSTYCGYSGPRPLNVRVGDTVSWSWTTGVHSVTCYPGAPDGNWDSGTHTGPFTFAHTFTQAGYYSYACTPGHTRWYSYQGRCYSEVIHESGEILVAP